jgi:hypothetical protein
VCVWLIPFAFFISLISADEALPVFGASAQDASQTVDGAPSRTHVDCDVPLAVSVSFDLSPDLAHCAPTVKRKNRPFLRRVMDFFRAQKETILPSQERHLM